MKVLIIALVLVAIGVFAGCKQKQQANKTPPTPSNNTEPSPHNMIPETPSYSQEDRAKAGAITEAQVNQVQIGMTYDEVVKLFGCIGWVVPQERQNPQAPPLAANEQLVTWLDKNDGDVAIMVFRDGRVSEQAVYRP